MAKRGNAGDDDVNAGDDDVNAMEMHLIVEYRKLRLSLKEQEEDLKRDPQFADTILGQLNELHEQTKLLNKSTSTRSATFAVLDAEILKKIVTLTRISAEAGESTFNEIEFAHKLARYYDGFINDQGLLSLDTKRWLAIGKDSLSVINPCPAIRILDGCLPDLPEDAENPSKPRAPRETKKRTAADIFQPTQIKTEVVEEHDPKIEEEVTKVFQILVREHATRSKNLPLLAFTFDPQSFSNTIRNNFYVSFLVGDGRVALWMINSTTYIRPANVPPHGEPKGHSHDSGGDYDESVGQATLSLSKRDWRQMVAAFDTNVPIIRLQDHA